MHELGVVFKLIDTVHEVAKENNVLQVADVKIELGEVSTVVPDLLQDCWKWAIKKSDVLKEATLTIETLPAITYCESCQKQYPTVQYGKKCPYCESEETYLIQGNEFNIKDISVYEE